jgi:hypothetical protein
MTEPSRGGSKEWHRLFLKKLASKLMPRVEVPVLPVRIAAFGKHPGWDDHVDDMGLETSLLVATKRLLYIEGIGGNIDSGAWENLRGDQRLEGFDHLFLWKAGGDSVVGRLWSSRDGKGRTRYPMVVCAHCSQLSLEWVTTKAASALERLKEECQRSESAAQVRGAVEAAQRDLAAAAPERSPEAGAADRVLSRLWAHEALGPDGIGLTRILYQIDREMGLFKKGSSMSTRGGRDEHRARQLRVPSCAASSAEAVLQWTRAIAAHLDASAGLFVIAPIGNEWVDVLVGDPGVAQFFVIRAARTTVPLTSDIPYNIEPQFVRSVREMVAL